MRVRVALPELWIHEENMEARVSINYIQSVIRVGLSKCVLLQTEWNIWQRIKTLFSVVWHAPGLILYPQWEARPKVSTWKGSVTGISGCPVLLLIHWSISSTDLLQVHKIQFMLKWARIGWVVNELIAFFFSELTMFTAAKPVSKKGPVAASL